MAPNQTFGRPAMLHNSRPITGILQSNIDNNRCHEPPGTHTTSWRIRRKVARACRRRPKLNEPIKISCPAKSEHCSWLQSWLQTTRRFRTSLSLSVVCANRQYLVSSVASPCHNTTFGLLQFVIVLWITAHRRYGVACWQAGHGCDVISLQWNFAHKNLIVPTRLRASSCVASFAGIKAVGVLRECVECGAGSTAWSALVYAPHQRDRIGGC
jgi:hypothetical protein